MNSTLPMRTFLPRRLSTWNITTRFRLLPWKSNTPRPRSASRIPTRPRPRISRRTTIPRKTILPAAATTVLDKALAGAVTAAAIAVVTVAGIVAAVAVGDAVADAIVADARKAVPADAICPLPNIRRHRAASPADTIIVVDSLAVTTIDRKSTRATRRLP